jgi:3-dehydroquinate synthase
MQNIINSTDLQEDLSKLLAGKKYDKLYVLTDDNTYKLCYPFIENIDEIKRAGLITIPAGDEHKNIETLASVWKYLSENEATRHSLLINLGGGMLTDLGGFAAASFKRGISCINIPTTLLGAVDAAVGGKTGINFLRFKNEIGAFAAADAVIIHSGFFRSLDRENLLSGYAELLKHSLIDSESEWERAIGFDSYEVDYEYLQELLMASVKVKERIVEEDPFEKGIRKALNLGHTIGHAFESVSMELEQPVLHGYAVAWGLICELYLSVKICGFPKDKMLATMAFIRENYGTYHFGCKSYGKLYDYMRHDKKNASADEINFTLLSDTGKVEINQTATKDEIFEAIDFMRESYGM